MTKIYLSQPMQSYAQQTSWATTLKSMLEAAGFEILDPYIIDVETLTPLQIVEMDLINVRSCDLLVANLLVPSYGGGTFGEIFEAKRCRIPVIVVCPETSFGPWLQWAATQWVNSKNNNYTLLKTLEAVKSTCEALEALKGLKTSCEVLGTSVD